MLLKLFAKTVFGISGWRGKPWPEGLTKCVLIEAPHTSMWDFFWGKMYFTARGLRMGVIIKKESFFWPIGGLLKTLGGIPVDRANASHIVDQMVDYLNSQEHLILTITPEGTRKKVTRWKHGFYHIAMKTNLPIAISYIDYKKKELGVFKVIKPSGNLEQEMKEIKSLYKGIAAKHPENFTWED
ncbi:MAG: 1-acyl-sn-glycerol-3-phosphate acyltransferase [Bacteroidia bacterium]|nr:1-acyl-sn-glycerol-3-phosphate acyltransferase [Bacteroidia bacterium]